MILWDQFLYFLRSRKARKPFMVMPAPYDQPEPSAKEYVLDCINLPFTKITYTQIFPHSSLQQFLRTFWHTVSQDAVLILCQRKLSSQPSCCAAAFESAWLTVTWGFYFVTRTLQCDFFFFKACSHVKPILQSCLVCFSTRWFLYGVCDVDITSWSILTSDWLYYLEQKM